MLRLLSNIFRKDIPKPLGRWNTTDNAVIKADYANMDSCGVHNHFTTTSPKKKLDKYYDNQPDYSYSKFCYQTPKATRLERINKLTEFLHKTR